MTFYKKLVLPFILLASAATLTATPPSEDLVRELLSVTKTRQLLDNSLPQIRSMMDAQMNQALQGVDLTASQRVLINNMSDRAEQIIKDELSWENLEPVYISIYQDSLTEEEIEGMLDFYKTPAGQAVINKLPAIMQNTMVSVQQRMGPMMAKLQALQDEFMAELIEDMEKQEAAE